MSGFNPLQIDVLGDSIVRATLARDRVPLADVRRFEGVGVYVLYYSGPHPAYSLLVKHDRPIYVGQARAEGSRKGIIDAAVTMKLSLRLIEHRNSVARTTDLQLADFTCRWLVLEPTFIALGEAALIRRFQPVWNVVVDGFGNHPPGSGRVAGLISRWDTLHPGRVKAGKARAESSADIQQEAIEYVRQRLPPPSVPTPLDPDPDEDQPSGQQSDTEPVELARRGRLDAPPDHQGDDDQEQR